MLTNSSDCHFTFLKIRHFTLIFGSLFFCFSFPLIHIRGISIFSLNDALSDLPQAQERHTLRGRSQHLAGEGAPLQGGCRSADQLENQNNELQTQDL